VCILRALNTSVPCTAKRPDRLRPNRSVQNTQWIWSSPQLKDKDCSGCMGYNRGLVTVYPNRRLVAGFRSRRTGFEPTSGHVGFVVDRVALVPVFSEYFGFPCQFSFHRLLHTYHHHHHHHLSSGWYNSPVADIPSGLTVSLTLTPRN
jgi:hypothetical protein